MSTREVPGADDVGGPVPTGVTDGAGPTGAGARSGWRQLLVNKDLRRLFACVVGFLVLAVMLGPAGGPTAPLSGFTGSLFRPRVLIFIGLGVALWLVTTARLRYGEQIRGVSKRVTSGPARLLPNRRVRKGLYLIALVFAIIYPMHISGYWQGVLVQQIGVYVLLALGLNVVVGYAGLLDLGYVAFYAIGAYACAYWTGSLPVRPPIILNVFWAIPLAILAAMLAGLLLGAPTLRLRGDYLAIVTLGFGEVVRIVATNLTSVTGGTAGVNVPRLSVNLLGIHYLWGVSDLPYYWLLLAFVVLVLVAFYFLANSRVGRAWTAIREDEVAAESTGLNVLKYKVMAFAIGASTSGFAGLLTATEFAYINPGSYTVQLSITVLVLVIFGGMGSLAGALIGAAVIEWFQWFLEDHPLFGYQPADLYMYIGALLVIMMIFRPEGIIPSRRRRREIGLAEHGLGTADAMSDTGGQVA